jgi:flavin reductase (DIM6/NTAB) family NADH-FMN oxidoreductase RutF
VSDDGDPAFDEIADTIDYPMWIVTAAARGERSGCLVGFATQCSIEPVRFGGRVITRVDTGDHVGFVLDPFAGEIRGGGGDRLTFQRVRSLEPGHFA